MTKEQHTDAVMAKVPEPDRYRWCCQRACACVGCASRWMVANTLTRDDWDEWVQRHPRTPEYLL